MVCRVVIKNFYVIKGHYLFTRYTFSPFFVRHDMKVHDSNTNLSSAIAVILVLYLFGLSYNFRRVCNASDIKDVGFACCAFPVFSLFFYH